MSNQSIISHKKARDDKAHSRDLESNESLQLSISDLKDSNASLPRGGRHTLSRRKALQDFYKINKDGSEEPQTNDEKPRNSLNLDGKLAEQLKSLQEPELLNAYLKTTPVEDILKLRNSIVNNLNSQTLEKKSIIYNNYQELIKLNTVLMKLSQSPPKQKASALDSFGTKVEKTEPHKTDESYLESALSNLAEFFSGEAKNYNLDFKSTVENIMIDSGVPKERFDSSEESARSNVEMQKLVREINTILSSRVDQLDSETKRSILGDIETILSKLNTEDELLILQLNEIKKKFI